MTQLLQNAVYGTALILAVAALRGALKDRLLPEARLALWAVCLFRLFTPIAPTSALSFWRLFGRMWELPVSAPAAPAFPAAPTAPSAPTVPGISAVPTAPTAPAAPSGAGAPWGAILAAVWIAVGVILAARYALAYVRTRRAVGRTIPLGREDVRYAALPKCARLREGPMDGAPLTFGVARPTVVLVPGLKGPELACVLAHEGVHARRRDNLWHYAAAAALTVFWWDPAVWLMARLIRRDVELSCDRAAVRRLGAERRAEYANALVTLSTQAEGGAFCHGFGPKRTEERIISVMKYKKATITGIALTLALVLAVTVGFASNPGAGMPDGESADSPAPATLIYEYVPSPAGDDFVRVNVPESGFYYDMPADGWNTYGPYLLVSARETDSRIEIYGTGEGGFVGEVELYENMNYTKVGEIEGLTLLTQTEVQERRDGSVTTIQREVYIYGQEGPDQCWVVELTWVEENLTEETADEPEIMRAIARSFTIGTDDTPGEPKAKVVPSLSSGGALSDDEAENDFVCYDSTSDPDVILREYQAVLDRAVVQEKLTQAEADEMLANMETLIEQAINGEIKGLMFNRQAGGDVVYAAEDEMYICVREDCGNNSVHEHDGVLYKGWRGKISAPAPDLCTREDCPLQPSVHFHEADGSVTYVYSQPPTETDDHGNEIVYCGFENCTIQGEHFHHDPEVEDHAGDAGEPIACPVDAIDKDFYQKYGDSHHSSDHRSDDHH